MLKIGAAKFKERCLALLDDLTPEGVLITKHGKPVARLIPVGQEGADLIGCLQDKIEIHGDLESTGVVWDVAEP
jgi:prevent-host-death family protein